MNRKQFIRVLGLLPLNSIAMKLNDLGGFTASFTKGEKMPVLFVGHGNPMNAITDNSFSRTWKAVAEKLPVPTAILSISAHWLTNGTSVTMSSNPKTIHDFGGFPDSLFKVEYPAPGAPSYAKMTANEVRSVKVHEDLEWGLDHGTWSVLNQMYPKANIPVFQLSIDYNKAPAYHFDLAKQLAVLRHKGVLIMASGNVVHNLGKINWQGTGTYDWALEFDAFVKNSIEKNDSSKLLNYQQLGALAGLAHPTNDHYLPLIYAVGLRDKNDQYEFFNDSFDMGSISMRSVIFK